MAATEHKGKGNTHFAKGRFEKAIECYTDAIELDSINHVLYSNRSAALNKLNRFSEADSIMTLVSRSRDSHGSLEALGTDLLAVELIDLLPHLVCLTGWKY